MPVCPFIKLLKSALYITTACIRDTTMIKKLTRLKRTIIIQ